MFRFFRFFSFIGLRSRFILIGIAVLVPLVLVMLQLAQNERENALANAKQRVELLAALTAERHDMLMQRARTVLGEIAVDWQRRQAVVGCEGVIASVLARHRWLKRIRMSTLDGVGVCADPPDLVKFNIAQRDDFKAVVAGEAFVVRGSLTSQNADMHPIILAAMSIRGEADQAIGVLSAAIKAEALAALLPFELRDDPAVVVEVIDDHGILLARHPEAAGDDGRPDADMAVVAGALQEPAGSAELADRQGARRMFAFHKVETVGWVVGVGISRDAVVGPVDAALRQRLVLIAAIVLGSCVIGLVGGEALVFWPLRALARTAQALESGDLAARPRLTGLSEVGALERSLNRMAEAIQQRETDLKTSHEAREQAVNDSKRANDAKSQFLASMSHEVRTPLGGIVGYTDLLLAQKLKPEQRRYAERIEIAAAGMIAVIDGILDISRIEAREVEIEHRPFLLASMIDNAVSMIRQSAVSKGLSLKVEFDPELPPAVLGDETRLRQVLINLLTNAVKFTSRGGVTLEVHRAERPDCVCFAIIDTGIGIATDQHHRLFKRFSQAHGAGRGDYGGSGLGLAISTELVKLMGGQLGFTSESDQGSEFWIEIALPCADASRLELHASPVQSPRVGRILVADDYEMNREITSAMLTMAGHEVDVVTDGREAVEAVRQKHYDLILMDIEMDGGNGMVAVGDIRRLEGPGWHVPVIAMTANVLPQQIRAFKEAGMDGHLAKPFTRDQLIDEVNLFLSPAKAAFGNVALIPARAAAFDKDVLKEMTVLLGEERTAAWVGALRTQLEAIVAIDKKAVGRQELARTAHALVSQAGSLGFTRLSSLSSELEEACAERADYSAALGEVRKESRGALTRIVRIQSNASVQLSGAG